MKGIATFLRNAKNINDTSWNSFVTKLERAAARFNSVVIKADRWFASSKTCSKCGYVKHDLKLTDREWTCPECGASHIRDVNAAVNLKKNALSTLGSREAKACGESCHCLHVSQIASLKQECLAVKLSENGNHLQ